MLTNRGWSYTLMGDYGSAIRDYDAALLADPTHTLALLNKAWTRALMGDGAGRIGRCGSRRVARP